jgi:phage baseplate assembly protein W
MSEKSLYSRTVIKQGKSSYIEPTGRSYRGVSTVSNSSEGFTLYDINLIKQDLINHFHIRQGEKLENPEFGTIIWDLLFDPLTDALQQAIAANVTAIVNTDPRVAVDNVIVSQYESGIQVECELTYLPYNISEAIRLKFDQDNGILD